MSLFTFVGAPVGLFDGDADGAVEGEPLGEVVGLLQFRYDEVICEWSESTTIICNLKQKVVIFPHVSLTSVGDADGLAEGELVAWFKLEW